MIKLVSMRNGPPLRFRKECTMNNVLSKPDTVRTRNKLRLGMILVTIGIVYGDIGTSPMYVMKSILEGNGGIGQVESRSSSARCLW